jgi:16S rRNA G527 N7-methylase RsmG
MFLHYALPVRNTAVSKKRAKIMSSEVISAVCSRAVESVHKTFESDSLKKNPVKKISRLRIQDKNAPKFSHFIKITLLGNCPLKK